MKTHRFMLIFVLVLGGCSESNKLPYSALLQAFQADWAAWKSRRGETVIERVGNRVITEEDVEEVLSKDGALLGKPITPEMRGSVLRALKPNLHLLAAAEKQGIAKDSVYLKERARSADQILLRLYIEQLSRDLKVSEAEKKAYYQKEIHRFRSTSVSLSVIRLKNSADLAQAQKLLQSGKSFAAVAGLLSIDPVSKKKGGKLPPIPIENLPPPLQQFVSTSKPGSLTPPVPSGPGFEILKLNEVLQGPPIPYPKAQEKIETYLRDQKLREKISATTQTSQ